MEVVSKGIEFQVKSGFPVGKFAGELALNYTINSVETTKSEDENGIIGRQLNYVPLHMGNGWVSLSSDRWRIFADGQLTGKRFVDDFDHSLPAYFITNAGIAYLANFQKHGFDLTFSVNNLFNVDYQNERYYAMPGRYFRTSLTYKFNTKNK
jgi:iron complex outermembrane receptor protein